MSSDDIFSLRGKVALITGGSRGIGKMIATEYVKRGVRVYITARKAKACDETAAELSLHGECVSIPGNVSTLEGIDRLVAEISKRESALDILVNNAGAAWGHTYETFPESGWDKVMDLNLKSVFFLTQKLTPMLRSAGQKARASGGHASVINIGSIDGIFIGHQGIWSTSPTKEQIDTKNYPYPASKSGLTHLSGILAKRLISDNIHVNVIAPGAFASEMNQVARDKPEAVGSMIPRGRVGKDEEMAGPAVFLASRAGGYCVGSTIVACGGLGTTGVTVANSSLLVAESSRVAAHSKSKI